MCVDHPNLINKTLVCTILAYQTDYYIKHRNKEKMNMVFLNKLIEYIKEYLKNNQDYEAENLLKYANETFSKNS